MAAKAKDVGQAACGCCADSCLEFRDFILRGNVVDLAVAVVIGGAFQQLIDSFIAAFITPLLGMIGTGSSNELYFSVNGAKFQYGLFITALLSFLVICVIIFYAVVLPLMSLIRRVYPQLATKRACPECLTDELPGNATRCKFCCSSLPPVVPKQSRFGSKKAGDEEIAIAEKETGSPSGVAPDADAAGSSTTLPSQGSSNRVGVTRYESQLYFDAEGV